MTDFIESFSTRQLLPPWVSSGCKLWAFVVRVERACIQHYLDRYFNAAAPDRAPFEYSALDAPAHFGVLIANIHSHFSSVRPGASPDTLSHHEIYWSFPVQRRRITPDNLLVEPTIVWVQPFVFDDNSFVMYSSREIWGNETEMATILFEEGATPDDLHVDVAIEGIKVFLPKSTSELLGCIHVRMAPGHSIDPTAVLGGDAGLEAFARVLAGSVLFGGASTAPADGSHATELNTLKQFRDVFDMSHAVYRAIVASRTSHTEVSQIGYYSGAGVELDFMWSDSVAEMLETLFGLEQPVHDDAPTGHADADPAGPQEIDWRMKRSRVPVELAISLTSNARFDVLGTLHTYGR